MNPTAKPQVGTTAVVKDGILTITHRVPFDGTPEQVKDLKSGKRMITLTEFGSGLRGLEIPIEGVDLTKITPKGKKMRVSCRVALSLFEEDMVKATNVDANAYRL